MTFKISSIPGLTLGSMLLLTLLLHCIQNPADNSWMPDGEMPDHNNYSYMKSVVQDSSGIFYGTDGGGTIFRFDSADIAADNQPENFAYLHNCNLYLNKNNLLAFSSGHSPWLLQQSHDSVAHIKLGNSYVSWDTLLPITIEDSILWLTTKDGEIFSWDGTAMTPRGDLYHYDGSPIKAIFSEDQGFHVFMYENFQLKYGFFENYDDTYQGTVDFESVENDSCILIAIYRLDGGLFVLAKVNSIYDNESETMLFEMTENFHAEIRCRFFEHPDSYLKTKDALYIKCYHDLYKFTSQTYQRLTSTLPLEGPLFLDKAGRPTLFYTPTRTLINIDSLPVYF